MPVAPTFPGVYIEEIPSGVRTITGVATSITAFVGRALRGPTNDPTTIFSFADFERKFGGLDTDHPMSYAVRDFYGNGGNQAIIVRVVHSSAAAQSVADAATKAAGVPGATPDDVKKAARSQANTFKADPDKSNADNAAKAAETAAGVTGAKPGDVAAAAAGGTGSSAKATMTLTALAGVKNPTDLNLVAATEGEWGNQLQAWVDYNTREDMTDPDPKAKGPKPDTSRTLFNLFVVQKDGPNVVQQEQFLRVAFDDNNPRYLPRVLKQSSNLARVKRNDGDTDWVPFSLPDAAKATKDNPILASGGGDGGVLNGDLPGDPADKTGIYALEKADLFNLLCVPADTRGGNTDKSTYQAAATYCQQRRAMLIVDAPNNWNDEMFDPAKAQAHLDGDIGIPSRDASNAALYFPRATAPDPLRQGQEDTFVPCGMIAGVMASTDVNRGVWKAPAGTEAGLSGINGVAIKLTNQENGVLNQLGINCLRTFPIYGSVIWGARTLAGADVLADDYKYVPVRRLALFLEESLYRGTQWVVFEPNDEPLWAQIRLNVGAFMHNLFVQGAFQGQTPKDAYFVKCDKESTTQNDINLGIVNVVVGFAPLKPAEFVILKIQQIAGNILT